MDCLNRYGNPKKKYNTQEEAQKVAETTEETHHERSVEEEREEYMALGGDY